MYKYIYWLTDDMTTKTERPLRHAKGEQSQSQIVKSLNAGIKEGIDAMVAEQAE
jgi:hypothetical protein